jgi:hypothetical protein
MARDFIQYCARLALNQDLTFNEVLSAAYLEKQKMRVRLLTGLVPPLRLIKRFSKFHSDSERGLGPVVASLSLGAPALMHFRLLKKYEKSEKLRRIALSLVLRHVS